ncbi:MAG TPA: surface-adhesin E family protein [Syntrophorhabdaceae bacterium]|jgi:hypothetical protein
MIRRLGFFCIVIFLALTTFGHGADEPSQVEHKWEPYSKDRQGVNFYYDKDAIVYGTDGVLKVWRKRDFPIRARYREIINLDEIDCFRQKYRALEIKVVGWDDSVESFKRVAEWSTIYGDSPEEYFLDTACKEFKKKKK